MTDTKLARPTGSVVQPFEAPAAETGVGGTAGVSARRRQSLVVQRSTTSNEEQDMLKVHHVNIVSPDLAGLDEFYRDVMEMKRKPGLDEGRKEGGYHSGGATWLTDGEFEFHLAVPNYNTAFDTKQSINPVHRGHIAFRTDDIEGFKKRLEERGIPYADFGKWAMKGWYQIFFHDPAGTVVEVHQVDDEAQPTADE